jgi:hypothetical protein
MPQAIIIKILFFLLMNRVKLVSIKRDLLSNKKIEKFGTKFPLIFNASVNPGKYPGISKKYCSRF